jgi:glucokinase
MACFTLGTGVGGGVIIGGRILVGPLETGGELGHITVEPAGRLCGCGARGCLEAYASATGLKGMLREALAQGRQSCLRPGDGVKDIEAACLKGDALAQELMAIAGRALGRAINNLVATTGADLIVLGGGVAKAWPLLEDATRRELAARMRMAKASRIKVIRAELKDTAAVLGAAALARQKFESKEVG